MAELGSFPSGRGGGPTCGTSTEMIHHFYVRALRELWRERRNCGLLTVAASIQALAHAAMAVCAGLLGQALVGRPAGDVTLGTGENTPLILCFVGFAAASVKALAAGMGTYGQRRAAFQVG